MYDQQKDMWLSMIQTLPAYLVYVISLPKYLYQWLVLLFIDTLGNTIKNQIGRIFNIASNYGTKVTLFWEAGKSQFQWANERNQVQPRQLKII